MSIREAFQQDRKGLSLIGSAQLVLSILWIWYEWGPWNEALRPIVISLPIDHYQNAFGALIAIPVAFVFTYIMQFFGGVLLASALKSASHISGTLSEKLTSKFPKLETVEYSRLSTTNKMLISVMIGTTSVVVLDIMVTGKTGYSNHKESIKLSSLIMAGFVTTLTSVVSLIYIVLGQNEATKEYADKFIGFIASPLTWIAIFTLIALHLGVKKLRSN